MFDLLLLAQNNTGQQPESPLGGWGMFMPLILVGIAFYFLLILPAQRRERKHRDTVLNALKKGDKVLTNAGIIGVVSFVKDEEVTLKLEEGKLRVLKNTIAKIYGAEEAGKEAPKEATQEAIKNP